MKLLTLFTMGFAACLVAQADTISYTDSTPVNHIYTELTGNNITLQKFDPVLGSLTSIALTISEDYDTQITVSNSPSASSNASGDVSTRVILTVSDPSSLFGTTVKNTTFVPEAGTLTYDLAPGDSFSSGDQTNSSSILKNWTTTSFAAIVAEFTGTGNIVLPISTVTTTSLNNSGGNASAIQSTWGDVTATVQYTYDVATTPEPGSMLLFGGGFLALGFMGRRRLARR